MAIELSEKYQVCLITKAELREANTFYAQGGLSTVLSREDSFDSHVEDTLTAGAGLCKPEVVKLCVEGGPAAVERLVKSS